MSRGTIALVLLAIITAQAIAVPVCAADDFDAYRKKQVLGGQLAKKEFAHYKEKQDKEFAAFLKDEWKAFKTFKGRERFKKPLPKHAPIKPSGVPVQLKSKAAVPASSLVDAESSPDLSAPQPAAEDTPEPAIPEMAPPPPQPKPIPISADTLEIEFYGNVVNFTHDPQWSGYRVATSIKPEVMSNFWSMMSGSQYEETLQSVSQSARNLHLDDWGTVSLWRAVVQALQSERRSEQDLLLWYFLVKTGYDVHLGYSDDKLHLFLAMKQQIYSARYIMIGEQAYYAVLETDHGSTGSFYTYAATYPDPLRPLDLQTASTVFTKPVRVNRTFTFPYKGRIITLDVPYDRRLVEYMDTFPQGDFKLYFDTETSPLLRQGLLSALKKYTDTMGEEEKVQFLLTFNQKAFAYKTDVDQFGPGREKCFFIEENMYFPYNNCKDRAVMFAWLVRELAGLKVIGLLYPGHLSTAVALTQIRPGFATVSYQGKRYVISDPTYIGASIGEPMPFYAKLQPERVVEVH